MATVKGPITLNGSLSNVSFYTRRGSDKVIARTKGGASKDKIKSSPAFAGFRLQQAEWKGCTRFASMLRYSFGGLHRLADYNLTPVLNGIAKEVQKRDEVNEVGKRAIYFSRFRQQLDGFNLNRNYPFNTVWRISVTGTIDRSAMTARVTVPYINTANDLQVLQSLPYFRIIVSLGAVSDMEHTQYNYIPMVAELHGVSYQHVSEWKAVGITLDEQQIEIGIDPKLTKYLSESVSLVLCVAVEFGKPSFTGDIQEVKYAGCSKVICCR